MEEDEENKDSEANKKARHDYIDDGILAKYEIINKVNQSQFQYLLGRKRSLWNSLEGN